MMENANARREYASAMLITTSSDENIRTNSGIPPMQKIIRSIP